MPSTSVIIPEQSKTKIHYIDHLKVVLTVLVIMHHAFITYGAPGGWYHSQRTTLPVALIPMTMFVAVNQAFFMGFFFFLSALFIPSSYEKKGPPRFTVDRLIRLGVPLIFYSLILSPILSFLVYYFVKENHITYFQFLGGFDSWIDFGVLWFVAALLLFTLAYVSYRAVVQKTHKHVPIPSVQAILLFATGIGILSYLVRIFFPVGWVWKPMGFQLGHFPQYIALFIIGLKASQGNWLQHADYQMGKKMAGIAAFLIFVGFPLFLIVQNMLNFPIERFNIGGHWQSLWYAVWEQVTGFALIVALICIGKQRWNRPSTLFSKLSRCAFAVYIFHPLVLISLSAALHTWPIEPALKLLIVAPLAVVLSFLLGDLIVKIPGVNKIV